MSDAGNPNDLHSNELYVRELIEEAKAHPHVEKSMLVRIYASDDPYSVLGLGIVRDMRWSDWYLQYVIDVEAEDVIYRGILAGRVERAVSRYGSFITYTVNGGRA
jgi:hypothetical protein